ncbi:MAG: hypothetical protein H7222_10315 [Methylotenera sp.]|nr:hypothetical protein [Oligoflexia bacterium]
MISPQLEKDLPPWLAECHQRIILPRRRVIETHPFMQAMRSGSAEPAHAERYFSGLMWHLLDFGKHVAHLMEKRPAEVSTLLAGRSEDKDGDTGILSRIVTAFDGPTQLIEKTPWKYRPHAVWIHHDALLRSVIYSSDLPWQVGAAGLNVGIEALVPYMIEPLFKASVEKYGISSSQAQWLESRAGDEEKQHGENGYILLKHFVGKDDLLLQQQCIFYMEALSHSMAYGLLQSGMRAS